MKNNASNGKSMIKRGFSAFTAWIYAMAAGGFFGKIFTSYEKLNKSFRGSFLVSFFGNGSRAAALVRSIRFKIAELFDQSAMLHLWRKVANFLIGCKMRFYGSFFVIFSVYTVLIYLVKRFAFSVNYSDNSHLICAFIMLCAAIPLTVSKKTVAGALLESKLGHRIIVGILGVPEEKLKVRESKHGDSYNFAIIAGLALGTLTYFVPPTAVIVFLALLSVIALVMTYPELGVVLTLFLLPFFGMFGERTSLLEAFVFLYSFAYLIKLIRVKRVIKAEIYDFAVIAFGAAVLFGGLVTLGGEASFDNAETMFLMLIGGFVALNLIRTEEWIKRCAGAVFAAGFTVSILTLISFVANRGALLEFGINIAPFIPNVDLMFEDANALAAYLVIAFALTLSAFGFVQNRRIRFICKLGLLTMPAAVLAVSSKSGALGILTALLAYCLFVKRKTLITLIGASVACGYAGYMLPHGWLAPIFMWLDSLFDSIVRTVYVWQGVTGLIVSSFFAGTGVSTFGDVYPRFAVAGAETAEQSSSVFFTLLCELGLPGLLIFICAILLVLQKSFEYMKDPVDRGSKLSVAGGLCAVLAILAQGLFYDAFSNMSIFYMFWFAAAYTVSCVRVGNYEADRHMSVITSSDSTASVDI